MIGVICFEATANFKLFSSFTFLPLMNDFDIDFLSITDLGVALSSLIFRLSLEEAPQVLLIVLFEIFWKDFLRLVFNNDGFRFSKDFIVVNV